MTLHTPPPVTKRPLPGLSSRDMELERRLIKAVEGDVCFDAFTRGRYATDASIYQMFPMGVVSPKRIDDIAAVLDIARERGVPVIMRGGGTSQNGQPIGSGIVVDCSRYLNAVDAIDTYRATVRVEPGVVLTELNRGLADKGLFFAVEPSTASRCTIGGMTGNNSCGARSLRYGKMVDNVDRIETLLADGRRVVFDQLSGMGDARALGETLLDIADRERAEIAAHFPKVQRRVGGYNLDSLIGRQPNLSHLLVGSEGTLAAFTGVTLKLRRLPKHRVMGVCHFPDFRSAMEMTQHIVALDPAAVELVDNNVLTLGADIPMFRRTLADITRGTPDCLLLVEFAGDYHHDMLLDLQRLDQCMGDHGFPDAVVMIQEAHRQKQVWEVREACLNIMMSMKGDGKPISFIEDCAVPLENLADYTETVSAIFAQHGTRGTWYAHASVGCLHVRPILNMKTEDGVRQMRAIAEETVEAVRRFKGSYSGEHGDGISRSEFIAPLFGERLAAAFGEVKATFDPRNALNPGKIVDPLRFDDRTLMRFDPTYAVTEPQAPALDWSAWGGFGGAVEMCNNNGTCRKLSGGGMCPSYRVTREERDSTRGRANALRLAISGQLGPDALTAPQMKEAMSLCVGCKACQRECPTGVDMAKMKVEFLHHYHARHGMKWREKLVAHLPHYAPLASSLRWPINILNALPGAGTVREALFGFSRERPLPLWQKPWRDINTPTPAREIIGDGADVIFFADTFNRYFEPENLRAAKRVLELAGYRLHRPPVNEALRPLCCGRTHLAVGQIDEARAMLNRIVDELGPYAAKGVRIVGIEPSCLLTLRDEIKSLLPPERANPIADAAVLFEELLAPDIEKGRAQLHFKPQGGRVAHLHGHCHQKAAGVMGPVETCLKAIPGLDLRVIDSGCCGMAGAFGYQAETHGVSMGMAGLSLLPAVKAAGADDWIVADGTSCRHQIKDGAGREAMHVARILEAALDL